MGHYRGNCAISLYGQSVNCPTVVVCWKASQTSSCTVHKARNLSKRDQQWMQSQSEAEGLEVGWTVTDVKSVPRG